MNIKAEKTMDDFIYMEKLELKYYAEEHVTPHEEAYLWHLANPKSGFVLEDGSRIAAFTDILPVKQDVFHQIAAGTLNDKYLSVSDLVEMGDLRAGDTLNLLLSCVVVDDEYRETDALKRLLCAHLSHYRTYAEKGIRLGTVLTSNVTMAGEHFSERLGFKKIGRSEHGTTLYHISFQEFFEQVNRMKPRLEEKLLQYERRLLDPTFCAERHRLEQVIASGFMEYGQSGRIYDRESMIRSLIHSEKREIEILNFQMECVSSHTAVVHYIAAERRCTAEQAHSIEKLERSMEELERSGPEPKQGLESCKRSLRTSIWIREDAYWKLFFHQGTALPD